MSDGIARHIVVAAGLFCAGGAGAHLVCLLFAQLFRRKRGAGGGRFSAFCVLLSMAIALYTLMVFFCKDLAWITEFVADRAHVVFVAVWSAVGVLVGCNWKLFVPLLSMLYAAASIGCVFLLQDEYGKQSREYAVSLESASVTVGDVRFARDSSKFQTLVFAVERVSDMVLLPIPREWYRLHQLDEDDDDFFYDGYYAGNVFLHDDATADDAGDTLLHTVRKTALRFLTSTADASCALYVPVPKDVLLPALFRLRFVRRGGDVDYQLIRDL